MESFCEICGNEVAEPASQCPYCQSKRTVVSMPRRGTKHRIINLERGMPLVAEALQRLRTELEQARLQGLRVLTLIHGYGSSGTGGAIKEEVRRQLDYLLAQGRITMILPGEEFSKRSGRCRHLLGRFPSLAQHGDFNRANPGITLVVL